MFGEFLSGLREIRLIRQEWPVSSPLTTSEKTWEEKEGGEWGEKEGREREENYKGE